MSSTKANTSRERARRLQRPTSVDNKYNATARGGRISTITTTSATTSPRLSTSLSSGEVAPRRPTVNAPRRYTSHQEDDSSSSSSSDSSSSSEDEEEDEEEEEEHKEDHRAAVPTTTTTVIKEKPTSPLLPLAKTSATATPTVTVTASKTDEPNGNTTTLTQKSVTRESILKRQPQVEDVPQTPISPAVPDAPDVFSYLNADSDDDDDDNETDHDHVDDPMAESQWLPPKIEDTNSAAAHEHDHDHDHEHDHDHDHDADHRSEHAANSSVSSSFHSDTFSNPPAGNETDRSSSPERSVKGHEDNHSSPAAAPKDGVSAKVASQIAAANKRQRRIRTAKPQYRMPEIPRGPPPMFAAQQQQQPLHPPPPPPPPQSMALSPSYYQPPRHPSPPHVEPVPVTGYELLASRLSSHADSDGEPPIKPMYRKFEALNHRVLLHLQDELSELEEQLHQIDIADTQSRRLGKELIVPASRREAARVGGELQWHKTDILGRIGYKLAQYNQALSSFNSTQSLESPEPTDISQYRQYLRSEHPIAEVETRFLDPTDDLVSVSSEKLTSKRNRDSHTASTFTTRAFNTPTSTFSSIASVPADGTLSIFAAAIAGSVLIPILTFPVIPNVLGRLTVAILVSSGIISALYQAGMVDRGCLTIDVMSCGAVYTGVMVIIAAVMA
ncbi:hypothetical protein F5884DRAFT_659587 [Xylogone sp. PMI_703]|nr:hypothetical protein F5884DRAFT_659587 [Xylogone sp. PMI_703]